jgi:hypothetical protein
MGMFRITLQKLLILLRLVIVASLTAYSLPSASAAMHGSMAESEAAQSSSLSQANPLHGVAVHSHGDKKPSAGDDQKQAKQECCKSFCAGMAILSVAGCIGGVRVAPIREFVDDAATVGELRQLHRPPNV